MRNKGYGLLQKGDQHSHFLSFLEVTASLSILRVVVGLIASPSTSFCLMGLPMAAKISLMLQLSLALHSTNSTPYFLARVVPSAKETWRSPSLQSTLLPTMTLHMDSGWDSLICFIQFYKFWKDFLSVTEQTKMTPAAPLQQVSVMVLKRSWPAVSQICILILTPSMLMVLILKSTPMVVMWVILYSSLTQRSRMLVLPTAVSPIITSFTRQSYFSYYRRLLIQLQYSIITHNHTDCLHNQYHSSLNPLDILATCLDALPQQVYNRGQQKQQQKPMSIFNDTNNSINEILEILKNYRTEGKHRESFLHDASLNTNTIHDEPSSFAQQPPENIPLRLHSSLENIPKRTRMPSTIRYKEAPLQDEENTIFSRLYEEDKALRDRRERLFLQGRKESEEMERKECTFSPHLRVKTGKCINEQEIESFYQKNISWKNRVEKEVKLKQVEKSSEGITHLTFAPKINKKRDYPSKENVQQSLLQKRGVQEYLLRQPRAKNCIETLQSRKKNAYAQMWNIKKSQFSYLH